MQVSWKAKVSSMENAQNVQSSCVSRLLETSLVQLQTV